jgi:hypothetical protein
MDSAQFHTPASFKDFDKSLALVTSQAEIAVVFVHGFDGDPTKTWVNFPYLIDKLADEFPIWKKCDLFFYSYKSQDQITPLAEDFLLFLRFALEKARAIIRTEGVRNEASQVTADIAPYRHLILVGHSTGAVIIRETILMAVAEEATAGTLQLAAEGKSANFQASTQAQFLYLLLNSSPRFFAPAHLGMIAAGDLGTLKSLPVLSTLASLYLERKPLYQNLKIPSPILNRIQQVTEELYGKFPAIAAFEALSLFGENEEIVTLDVYRHEQKHKLPVQRGHNHTSVCKPNAGYKKPLEFVISALHGKSASV